MTTEHTIQRQRWLTRWLSVALGAVLIGLGAGVSPVYAATLDGMLSFNGFYIGAFLSSDGTRVYCLEPGASSPDSEQLAAIRVSELPAYSYDVSDPWGWVGRVETSAATGEVMRRMNWVLTEHGVEASPELAVSVQIALWELRREPGNAAWIDGKLALVGQNGGQHFIDAGVELARLAHLEARGPGNVVPESGLTMVEAEAHGSGVVSYPAGTTSITIEGGTFADGSTTVKLPGAKAGSMHWSAGLHEPGWNRLKEVVVSGTWGLQEKYWPAELVLHPPSREFEQLLGAGISPVTGVNKGNFEAVSVVVDSVFEPQVTTAVPQGIVSRGEAVFSDTVTVSSDPDGTPWPSRANGAEYLPLRSDGTLYGPFLHPQVEQPNPPAGSPVAARTSVLVDQGPGTYDVQVKLSSVESGYYYWVWEISEQAQDAVVRESGLLESGFWVADQFGVHEESQLVSTELRWITQLKNQVLQPGESVLEDSVRVTLRGGGWLRDEAGNRIPANMRFTVYQSDNRPVRQADVPAEARELGQVFAQVSEHDTWTDAPSFEMPADERGWVTVQTCVLEEDQDPAFHGRITEWCDDYGVPEETARLVIPEPVLAETGAGSWVVPVAAGAGVLGIGVILVVYEARRKRIIDRAQRRTQQS